MHTNIGTTALADFDPKLRSKQVAMMARARARATGRTFSALATAVVLGQDFSMMIASGDMSDVLAWPAMTGSSSRRVGNMAASSRAVRF